MLSGGSGEIEAARLRVVAAKSKKESALEMVKSAQDMNKSAEVMTSSARFMMNEAESMESKAKSMMNEAKAMMDTSKSMAYTARTNAESAKAMAKAADHNMAAAQSQLDTADTEISDAEAMLGRVEDKWQVIDVDESPKKAEKSSNSTTNNNDVNGTDVYEEIDAFLEKSKSGSNENNRADRLSLSDSDIDYNCFLDSEIAAGLQAGNLHSLTAVAEIAVADGNIQQVTVTGCGTKAANGTYKRDPNFIGSTHHNSFTRKTFLVGDKTYESSSRATTYALYRKDSFWYVSIWNDRAIQKTLYRSMNRTHTDLPSVSGWITMEGVSPAPTLKWGQ